MINVLSTLATVNYVQANIFKQILPEGLFQIVPERESRVAFVLSLLRSILVLFFAVIVLVAIFYAGQAGLKYIQSKGEEGEVKTAQEALKNIFIGLLVAFVGVILVVLVANVFLGAEVETALTCLLEPETFASSTACVH
jgi:hypothetical protein